MQNEKKLHASVWVKIWERKIRKKSLESHKTQVSQIYSRFRSHFLKFRIVSHESVTRALSRLKGIVPLTLRESEELDFVISIHLLFFNLN